MKRLTLLLVLFFLSLANFSKGQIYTGLATGYNTQSLMINGISLSVISNNLKLSGSFLVSPKKSTRTVGLYKTDDIKTESSFSETRSNAQLLNVDFSYLFTSEKAFFYPTIGLNFYRQNVQSVLNENYYTANPGYYYNYWQKSGSLRIENEYNIGSIGVNLGGGIHYDIGKFAIEFDGIYTLADGQDHVSARLGVLFNIMD